MNEKGDGGLTQSYRQDCIPEWLSQSSQTFMGTQGPAGWNVCCDDQREVIFPISGAELRLGACVEGHSQDPGFKAGAYSNSSTLGPGLLYFLGIPIPFLGSPKFSSHSPQGNPEGAPGAMKDGVQEHRGCTHPVWPSDQQVSGPAGASRARLLRQDPDLDLWPQSLLEPTASSTVARKLGQCWAGRPSIPGPPKSKAVSSWARILQGRDWAHVTWPS